MERNVVIMGSGPAGFTAAIYAARSQLEPLLVEGPQSGGQLTITTNVENFPGFVEPISGMALMANMKEQAIRLGAEVLMGTIDRVDLLARPFVLTMGKDQIKALSLIIATGASARWLNIESEKKLIGKGVSACATCDGFFFKGEDVVVVGGGDTALEEAIFLTRFASHVSVVHRRDALRGTKILQDRAKANSKISFIWDSVVKDILGEKGVEGVLLQNVKTKDVKKIQCKGVFVAIGHTPRTDIFKGQLELDQAGYIVTKKGTTQTSVEGVFASGDCMDPLYRQAVVAAGTGCMAAIEAQRFLAEKKK